MYEYHVHLASSNNPTVRLIAPAAILRATGELLAPHIVLSQNYANSFTPWTVEVATTLPAMNVRKYKVPELLEPGANIRVEPLQKRVVIKAESEVWTTQLLVRQIRHLMRLQLAVSDQLFVHAGFVRIQGKGVAIVGPKCSGKTTLILGLLAFSGAAFVCNDDLSIAIDERVNGIGWPRSVRIRRSTLQSLPTKFFSSATPTKLQHPENYGEIFPATPGRSDFDYPTVHVLPKELGISFNAEIIPHTELHVVLFPDIRSDNTLKIRLLNPSEGIQRLCTQCAPYTDIPGRGFAGELASCFKSPLPEQTRKAVESIGRQVLFFSVRFRPDVLQAAALELHLLIAETLQTSSCRPIHTQVAPTPSIDVRSADPS